MRLLALTRAALLAGSRPLPPRRANGRARSRRHQPLRRLLLRRSLLRRNRHRRLPLMTPTT